MVTTSAAGVCNSCVIAHRQMSRIVGGREGADTEGRRKRAEAATTLVSVVAASAVRVASVLSEGRRYWLCGTDTVTSCVVMLPKPSVAVMVMV
jgi:hypothetical protein